MVSASLQSGGAACVSSWMNSPSLTYCSSWACRWSGSGSGSGSRSGAGGWEGAGEASLAHLSQVERNRGHGPLELELHRVYRSTWQDRRQQVQQPGGEEGRRDGEKKKLVQNHTYLRCCNLKSTLINAPLSFPTESLTSSAAAESALCCLPASWINHSLSTADITFHLSGNEREGRLGLRAAPKDGMIEWVCYLLIHLQEIIFPSLHMGVQTAGKTTEPWLLGCEGFSVSRPLQDERTSSWTTSHQCKPRLLTSQSLREAFLTAQTPVRPEFDPGPSNWCVYSSADAQRPCSFILLYSAGLCVSLQMCSRRQSVNTPQIWIMKFTCVSHQTASGAEYK